MFFNQIVDFSQRGTSETPALRQFNRLQPEFGVALRLFDMNVPGFVSFPAEEEKPEAADSEDLWHDGILLNYAPPR